MTFAINYNLAIGDESVTAVDFISNVDAHRDHLDAIATLEAQIVLSVAGKEVSVDDTDPVVRFAAMWLRKIPWIISGDTETVAMRNSEHCFAFLPAGPAVELSFFEGTEAEIGEYILDPVNIKLDDLTEASLQFGRSVLSMAEAIDSELLGSDEDCIDLAACVSETEKAWHEHKVRHR